MRSATQRRPCGHFLFPGRGSTWLRRAQFSHIPSSFLARSRKLWCQPYLTILAHPTGRLVLRRKPFGFDVGKVVAEARRRNISMEMSAFPDRLDLREHHIRLCQQQGVKQVISTDSHHTKHLVNLKYGVLMARRGWLEKRDVLNTLPTAKFQQAIQRRC